MFGSSDDDDDTSRDGAASAADVDADAGASENDEGDDHSTERAKEIAAIFGKRQQRGYGAIGAATAYGGSYG
eukprot:COSAG06_NODE_25578_length_633_cov_1.400749_1_plen_71_part_10